MSLSLALALLCFTTAIVANACTLPSLWSEKNLELLAERQGFDTKPWRIIADDPKPFKFMGEKDWNLFPDRVRSAKKHSNPQAKRVITSLAVEVDSTTSCPDKLVFYLKATVDGKTGVLREKDSILSFYPQAEPKSTGSLLFWGKCPGPDEKSAKMEIFPLTGDKNCNLPPRVVVYQHGGKPRLVLQEDSAPGKALQLLLEAIPATTPHTTDLQIPNFSPANMDRTGLAADDVQHILDAGVFLQAVKAGKTSEVSDKLTSFPLHNLVHLVWENPVKFGLKKEESLKFWKDGRYQFRVNLKSMGPPWLPTTFMFQGPQMHGMRKCAEGKTPDGKILTCPFRNDEYLDLWLYDPFSQSLPAIDKVERSGEYELIPDYQGSPSIMEVHSLPSERGTYSREPLTHGQIIIIREQNRAGSSHLLCASDTEPSFLYFKYFENPTHLEEDDVVKPTSEARVNPDPECQFRVLRRSLMEKPNGASVAEPVAPSVSETVQSADETTKLSGQVKPPGP